MYRDLRVECEFWLKIFLWDRETVKAETEKERKLFQKIQNMND